MQSPIKSNIKSIYGFFLFAVIDEVSSSGCLENEDPRRRRPKTEDLENEHPP